MGGSKSKEEQAAEDADRVFDKGYIAWDEFGNLRYGLVHPISREKQLREILNADILNDEEGQTWYVVNTAWLASWLAYVHIDKGNAPAPGPCRNDHIIEFDPIEDRYKARPKLFAADGHRPGDYRRVSVAVWQKFLEYYPGSGPTITMIHSNDPKKKDDTSSWVILDPPLKPEIKQKKFKILKPPLPPFFNKKSASKANIDGDNAGASLLQKEGEGEEGGMLSQENSSLSGNAMKGVRNEPKLVGLSVNYSKVDAGGAGGASTASGGNNSNNNNQQQQLEGKGSISIASKEVETSEAVAARREKFFDNVYYSKD